MKLSTKSTVFIRKNVLPKLNATEITGELLPAIVDYITDYFEVPLAQAKENGEPIDENLLETAAAVITEITTNPDW